MARPQQQEVDELFDIRNYYYIGNYQFCINEAHKLKKTSSVDVALERDAYAYRAYMAQNKFLVVLDEIKPNAPEKIRPLKMLAEYLSGKVKRETVLAELEQSISGNIDVENTILILVVATIYLNEGNKEAAYRILSMSDSLEASAMALDILLKIDRVDIAKKKLKDMQTKDDDATLTQLAQAWVNLAVGGEKLHDAYYIFDELVEKYGATPLLLNGQAVAFLGQGKYAEAESVLQQALDRDSNYPDTLINMIMLVNHNGKDAEVANRYLSQLKDSQPNHSYILDLQQKEAEFDKIADQFAPSNATTLS